MAKPDAPIKVTLCVLMTSVCVNVFTVLITLSTLAAPPVPPDSDIYAFEDEPAVPAYVPVDGQSLGMPVNEYLLRNQRPICVGQYFFQRPPELYVKEQLDVAQACGMLDGVNGKETEVILRNGGSSTAEADADANDKTRVDPRGEP